ncbi:MAG: hypothetical protein KU28_11600 [Sulfurovum sp. PC08-66]|nr:MAG: hypothetical protein KU28_11600 [Sulfurovum sp. PC08-66]
MSTLELNATKIVNITDTQLYAYGNRTIYQVDTTNPYAPRLLSSFNFEQTTNDLYFDEQILYTPRYMIDTDALMLSSPILLSMPHGLSIKSTISIWKPFETTASLLLFKT